VRLLHRSSSTAAPCRAASISLFVDGADVRTVESLDANGQARRCRRRSSKASAFQCGYCTPGFVLMVTQLLDEHPDPDDEQIKHYLTGNLCRCATYPEVMDAVKLAAGSARPARRRDRLTPGHSGARDSVPPRHARDEGAMGGAEWLPSGNPPTNRSDRVVHNRCDHEP
jgi:xanthine dehydrogenase iron-sulfur cluster and FAD-binding subunit A